MTPMEAVVATDRKLAAVLTYLRTALGNNASAVTPEEAKALRDKWQDIKVPVTRAKLEELEEASRK
ncbi:hypothetical protein [Luteolibacter sp. Populi]|uniref:hypothetical protein n=1 Tax=Luteolibacter sp. Populi TaxID=3230487 RepID=UPI0034656A0E